MISIDFNSIVILNICGVDYHRIIDAITKSEAMNLLQNADFRKKMECLQDIKKFIMYKR